MICPACGHLNLEGSLYCSQCGQELGDLCSNCGAILPPDASYCRICGEPTARISVPHKERRLVTVLFADLIDSTELGESLDPEQYGSVLSTFFDSMREEIEAEGGVVEKFIGDAILAAFGVPVAHEDDPARALKAALRMRQRLIEVNDKLGQSLGIAVEVRMGVNTGVVLASLDPAPGEPIVTGDVVNAAARLQDGAAAGQIVVAERTARAVRGFTFDDVGNLQLRGRSESIRAVELMDAPAIPQRSVLNLAAPMIGRETELALLRSNYSRAAAEGRPHLVTIYGDAGIGKSRLVEEFLDWAGNLEEPPTTVRGRCLPYGDGVTYWPLAEILKGVARIRNSDSRSNALERVMALGREVITEDMAADPEQTLQTLAYTIGIDSPDSPYSGLDPREVRRRMHEAWRSFVSALASRRPLVFVVEDLHWADPALLEVLRNLTEKTVGPVLFLTPARPQLVQLRPDWGSGMRNTSAIHLDPLTAEEGSTLMGSMLSGESFPAGVEEKALSRAEGNPFFLEQILLHLIDDGRIIRTETGWSAVSGDEELDIPYSVQATLAARIDLLEPEEKSVAQRAAVVGRIFWAEPVKRLMGLDADPIRAILDRLERKGLVATRLRSTIAGEAEYMFRHVLTREVAYESLPRGDRAVAHAMVASWIEETAGDRAPEFTELLVYHFGEAYMAAADDPRSDADTTENLRRSAFQTSLLASDAARVRGATERAYTFGDRARSLATDPQQRARALNQIGRAALGDASGDLAWESLREAADILIEHDGSQRREIAMACALAVESPTRWPGSMMNRVSESEIAYYLDVGLGSLEASDESEEMVRLLSAKAFAEWSIGASRSVNSNEQLEARLAGERAVAIAEHLDRPDLLSAALDAIGSLHVSEGFYGLNVDAVEHRVEVALRGADLYEAGDAYAMAAWTYSYVGDYENAMASASEGMAMSGPEGGGFQVHCAAWGAYSAFWQGDWRRVIDEIAPRAREMLGDHALDPPNFAAHLFGVEAFIRLATDAPGRDRSSETLKRMARREGDSNSPVAVAWWAWVTARRDAAREALQMLDDVSHDATSRPFREIIRASVLLEHRMFDAVPDFLEGAKEYATNAKIDALYPHLDRLEAVASLSKTPSAEASLLLDPARRVFLDQGAGWEMARTDLLRANSTTWFGGDDVAGPIPESEQAPVLSAVPLGLDNYGSHAEANSLSKAGEDIGGE